jgi:hypothetical protein
MTTRNGEFGAAAQEPLHSARIHRATGAGVINWMDTQLIAFLMFLLLSYLLFRRPASAAQKRYPTELDFQLPRQMRKAEASKRGG